MVTHKRQYCFRFFKLPLSFESPLATRPVLKTRVASSHRLAGFMVLDLSVDKWNHVPASLNRLTTELLRIPGASVLRRDAQVDTDKEQGRHNCSVQQRSFRSGDYAQREVNQAFSKIMGADQGLEERMLWQRVLRKRRQVLVTVILHARGDNEKWKSNESLQTRCSNSPNTPIRARSRENSWRYINTDPEMNRTTFLPPPSDHTAILMLR